MFCFKSGTVYFTFLCVLCFVRCLEVPALDDNDLASAEAAIRGTFNHLFVIFKIRDVARNPKLKEYSITHNVFVSMTLNDGENLKKITQLSRVYNIDDNALYFMTQINDIFNEGDKSYEVTDDKYVDSHIVKFINKLKDLQKSYAFNRNFANYSINANILEHLDNSVLTNVTHNYYDEIWKPTERSGRRVFRGHRTHIKHFPFVVSVHFFERFQCAGSIIEKDLVITAASCLQLAWNNRFFRENPAFLSVQVGSNFYEASGENIAVYEIYFHPAYTPKTLVNNLAVMRLMRHIKFDKRQKKVKRIEIDRNPSALSINTDGIIIVGWGATDHTNVVYEPWLNKLSFAELDYYSLLECQHVYSKQYVTYKNFCAGFFSKAGGACRHDIGGPGMAAGILVGVISFGPATCGTPDAPTVFTKIGYYADWIDNIIEMPALKTLKLTTLLPPKNTVDTYFSEMAQKQFHIDPIEEGDEEITRTPDDPYGGDTVRPPKKDLRVLGDNKLFDEFFSTLFVKNDKDYSASYDDKETESETTKLVQRTIRTTLTTSYTAPIHGRNESLGYPKYIGGEIIEDRSKKRTDPQSITTDAYADEIKSTVIEDITKIKTKGSNEVNLLEMKSIQDNNKVIKTDVNTDQTVSENDDSKLEKDIMELLDDIDLRQILAPEENLSSSDTEKNITQHMAEGNVSNKINIGEIPQEYVETASYSSDESSSKDDEGLGLIFE